MWITFNMIIREKKKILFIITKSVWGGAQRYVFDLATHLPKDRYDAVVVTGGNGPLVEKLTAADIRVITLPSLARDIHAARDIAMLMRLAFIFKKETPAAVHLNSSKMGVLGALAGTICNFLFRIQNSELRIKIVFTAHGWAWSEDRPQWQKKAIVFLTRFSARFQDSIIVLSRYDMATALRYGIPQEKLSPIPLGILPQPFLSPLDAQKALSEKIGITFQRPLFGTIAELTKNKGLPYLIQALIVIKQKRIPFTCVIIGDGEYRESLRTMIEKNNLSHNVFLAGFVPNASVYMKAFDFFVLPSIKEGLPYVLLEALAAGTPIVSTIIGGIPDIVDDKKNGLLVEARDPHALAHAIETMIASREAYSRFSAYALEKSKTFSFEQMLHDTLSLYAQRT